MTPADVVAAGGFFAIIVAGLIVRALRDMARRRPTERIRQRVTALHDPRAVANQARSSGRESQQLFSLARHSSDDAAWRAWVSAWQERVQTVSGPGGMRAIGVCAAAA